MTRILMRLKVRVYRTVVRLVMIYGPECWALKKKNERRLEMTEIMMLRRMPGNFKGQNKKRGYENKNNSD